MEYQEMWKWLTDLGFRVTAHSLAVGLSFQLFPEHCMQMRPTGKIKIKIKKSWRVQYY